MKTMASRIMFSKSPVKYIWFYWIFPTLPLPLKVKFAILHFKWQAVKSKLIDKLLGKKYVSVHYVYREWTMINDVRGKYMMREIAYVYRRRHIPWALSKERRGFQTDQLGMDIMHSDSWDNVVSTLTKVREAMEVLETKFIRRLKQVDAFKNPTLPYHLQ